MAFRKSQWTIKRITKCKKNMKKRKKVKEKEKSMEVIQFLKNNDET